MKERMPWLHEEKGRYVQSLLVELCLVVGIPPIQGG